MPSRTKSGLSDRALILFAHGARDPRWAEPLQVLQQRLATRAPGIPVALAFLELMPPDLASAAATLVAGGARRLQVVPVFLGQGGHVRDDLPRLVDALRLRHPEVDVRLSDAVGEVPEVLDAIADYCARQAHP